MQVLKSKGMNRQSPFWLALLTSWCANRDGLTLPFIVGADAIRRGVDVAPEDTRRLFAEICQSRTPVICLRLCPDMGVPILAIHPFQKREIQVMLDNSWGANDAEKLDNYASNVEKLVRAGLFSRIDFPNRKWATFQRADLEFVESVIQTYDNA